ncbi:MAG: NAD kinase [Pseudomonadota bacterium]
MNKNLRLALAVSDSLKAQAGAQALRADYAWVPLEEADAVVALGGDGFLLHVLHQMLDTGRVKPCYGINLGTVGFLMNRITSSRTITERIARAREVEVVPLQMDAVTQDGQHHKFYAINEVSLLRETRQSAKLEVAINGKVRMQELAADGVLVATAAGSTAYNLSANGPILPLGSKLLALTPISPFRPRRWRGAILPESAKVSFKVREPAKRPVAAVADQQEVRDVAEVHISVARDRRLTLLFDPGKTLDERIFAEQFQV